MQDLWQSSDLLNSVVSILVAIGAVVVLIIPQRGRFKLLDQPFAKGALSLYIIRSIGFAPIYIYVHHHQQACVKADSILLVMVDIFTLFSLWMWLSVLRGTAYPGFWTTLVQILAACTVIVSVDLPLAQLHSWPAVLPSALLNEFSFGCAVGAAAFRYRRQSIPLIVALSTYNWLQLPAYRAALLCDPRPEPWVYYALAFCKAVNVLLICDLLLRPVREEKAIRLLPLLKKPWAYLGIGPIAALVALAFVITEHWASIRRIGIPLDLSLSVLVPVFAVMIAVWERFGKSAELISKFPITKVTHQVTLELTEDEYERLRSKAKERGVSTEDLIRASVNPDGGKSGAATAPSL